MTTMEETVPSEVLAVRQILHAYQRAMTPPDSGWGDMSYAKGSYDHLPTFRAALEAYRALRAPTPTPEGEREAIARIIDPHLLRMRDAGQLNGRGHEMLGEVLSKADQILARRVG